jgi:putative Flp pilus-assembly TadE/G-like protein
MVFAMLGLLGMCALVIDAGYWYQAKAHLQSAADAGALAGADTLAAGWPSATSSAGSVVSLNMTGATASYQQATTFSPNDSIVVTATRTEPSFFARLFGHNSVNVSVTAEATMVNSGGGAVPWGVMQLQQPYQPGTTYQLYTDNSGPNNGALRLPGGTGCSTSGGSSLYSNEITGNQASCPLMIGQLLSTNTGQNTGPTTQGMSDRCPQGLQPVGAIATFGAGTVNLLDPTSCQLVLVPVVLNASDNSATWPTKGSVQVKVVGFAWFIVTAVNQGGKEVDAVYVGDAPADPSDTSSLPSAYQARLTG